MDDCLPEVRTEPPGSGTSGKPVASPVILTGHTGPIYAVALAPDGRLVTGSDDKPRGSGICISPGDGHLSFFAGTRRTVYALAFTSDGRLVSGSFDKTVRVWDLKKPNDALWYPPRA